jgi:cysteine desulfurase
MSRSRIYMDWNAGAPLRAAVRDRVLDVLTRTGNASSVHGEGRAARAAIEEARAAVARLAGTDPDAVTFTSGGTEANVTALTPDWTVDGRPVRLSRLLVSAVEHPSVARGGRFPASLVETIPVDGEGGVRIERLAERLRDHAAAGERVLVSVMAANNETGVIQPVPDIAAMAREFGAIVHVDAVQAAGRMPVDLAAWGVDAATLSAHKIGGPQGVGAVVRRSTRLAFAPLLTGGGQESSARAGTEPVALIAGFGVAAEAARTDLSAVADVRARRDRIEAAVRAAVPDAVVFSAGAGRLANTVAFACPGVSAETLVIALDLAGIAVSAGSACSSGKVSRSATLAAMGHEPSIVSGGVRVSIGPTTTDAEIDRFAEVFAAVGADMTKGQGTRAA